MRPLQFITDGVTLIWHGRLGPCPVGCYVESLTIIAAGQDGTPALMDPRFHLGFSTEEALFPVAWSPLIVADWQATVRLWTPPAGVMLVNNGGNYMQYDFRVDSRLDPSERSVAFLLDSSNAGLAVPDACAVFLNVRRAARRDLSGV